MSIRRACSYQAEFTLSENAASYAAIQVTISQRKKQIINKGKTELDLDGLRVILRLTQEETLLFSSDAPAQIQLRAYKSPYVAPGSKIWTIDVNPSLNEEVLT